MSFFFQSEGGNSINSYLIRIVSVRTPNMPSESQTTNLTLCHHYNRFTLSVKVITFGILTPNILSKQSW